MARLWQLLLICCAQGPLCLPSTIGFTGTQQECQTAHFVPGYNLGGEGFDIVTMERKGAYIIDTDTWKLKNGSCRLYHNSYMNEEKQKVPVAVVDWRSLPKCSIMISSIAYDSVESVFNGSTSAVSNDWKVGLELIKMSVGLGGSHSRESIFSIQKSKQDRYGNDSPPPPPPTPEFLSAINSLPSYSRKTEASYCGLIDTYGTHYISQVSLGGEIKSVTSVKTCQATMNGVSETEIKDCLLVEALASFGVHAKVQAMYQHCQQKKKELASAQSFSIMFNEHYTEVIGGTINEADFLFEGQSNPSIHNSWLSSLKTNPDVVRYSIKPLHTILPRDHAARERLKEEVQKNILNNAVLKKCSETCQIGHRSNKRDPCACVCIGNNNVKSNCCPGGRGLATLQVYNLYAQDLYGDVWTQTDGSVVVTYSDQRKNTDIIPNNDNPAWSENFEFGPIVINMINKLTFSVYDEDTRWDSDLLGECSINLRKGEVREACMLNHGALFFTYMVKCAPSLGGNQCQEYIPSPMSPSLAKVFHSRNGVLLRNTE
ncbi:LOW QUALITY PROTEIN: perforin-1-like [Aulostomus maculatus]